MTVTVRTGNAGSSSQNAAVYLPIPGEAGFGLACVFLGLGLFSRPDEDLGQILVGPGVGFVIRSRFDFGTHLDSNALVPVVSHR